MKEKNIVIIGMRGTGKSVTASKLGKILERKVVDMDREIEAKKGVKIAEIVEDKGWDYFRDLERKIVQKYAKKKGLIIACGGGTPAYFDNGDLLKKSGIIILLRAKPETIYKRIKKAKHLPSLTSKHFTKEIAEIWHQRKLKYQQLADLVVDVDKKSEDGVVKAVLEELKRIVE